MSPIENPKDEEYEIRSKRFDRLMIEKSDLLAMVLKGHLLIEEQLQGIIEAGVSSPAYTRKARLSFSQRLNLAQAITGHFSKVVNWRAIEALNAARNKLAHNVEPGDVDKVLQPFMNICGADDRLKETRDFNGGTLFYIYVSKIWAKLDALNDVVKICRKQMPLP